MKTKPLVDMATYIIVTIIFLIILIPALIAGGGFYLITSWIGLANKIKRKEVNNGRPS
jgi:hypothetical protein